MKRKVLLSSLFLALSLDVSMAANNLPLEDTNPTIVRTLESTEAELSDDYSKEDASQDIEKVLINPFNSKFANNNAPPLLFATAGPQAVNITVERVSDTDLIYNIRAELVDFDVNDYYIEWAINGVELKNDNLIELKNIRLKEGDNVLDVSIVNRSNGNYVSTLVKHFDTSVDLSVKILSLDAVPVKYSNGFFYNFYPKIENMNDSKYSLLYELNGSKISKPGNVAVKEGENTIKLSVINNETSQIVASKEEKFTAQKELLRISHLLVITGDDINHFSFIGLYWSYDSSIHKLEWLLDGNVITNLDDVYVSSGEHTITLNIKDKETDSVLVTKSKTWNTSEAVGIASMTSEKITDSDGLSYKVSAECVNYDSSKHDAIWTLDGSQVNPDNVRLNNNETNKVILSIYDKENGELLAAKNIKIDVAVDFPVIKNIYINADAEESLLYSFSSRVDNFNSRIFRKVWILNGEEIDSPNDVYVKEGSNTLKLVIINNYTGEEVDSMSTDFDSTVQNNLKVEMSGDVDTPDVLVRNVLVSSSGKSLKISATAESDSPYGAWSGFECALEYQNKMLWDSFNGQEIQIDNFDNSNLMFNCKYSGNVDAYITIHINLDGEEAVSKAYRFESHNN